MASLGTVADSFLDDLDDLGDSEEEDGDNLIPDQKAKHANSMDTNELNSDEDSEDENDEEENEETKLADIKRSEAEKIELELLLGKLKNKGIEGVISLRKSGKFKQNMASISEALENPDMSSIGAILEEDREYNLILTSNKMIQDISEEIDNIHRCVAEIYAKKFPELESLISNKLDYIRTVQRIGNEMDMTLVELNVRSYSV
jgi:U4/U6 small nuclear ribonucleoprotein PRP31